MDRTYGMDQIEMCTHNSIKMLKIFPLYQTIVPIVPLKKKLFSVCGKFFQVTHRVFCIPHFIILLNDSQFIPTFPLKIIINVVVFIFIVGCLLFLFRGNVLKVQPYIFGCFHT